ncbi:MAG: GTP-binding protein, partial [Pseudomonadota bacterium]
NGFKDHVPETEEYGISSFVYRARLPFVPEKLHAFFNKSWPGVVRAKGFFWLATRPGFVGELSQAGAVVRHQACGLWWAAAPKNRWPDDPDTVSRIMKGWDKTWGDRRQQLVFIGLPEMDKAAITAELDACLIDVGDDGRIDMNEWRDLPDPFPRWGQAQAAE